MRINSDTIGILLYLSAVVGFTVYALVISFEHSTWLGLSVLSVTVLVSLDIYLTERRRKNLT